MINWNNLDELSSYKKLEKLKGHVAPLREMMAGEDGAKRVAGYSVRMATGLVYNYAAKQVDDKVIDTLQKLADEAQLIDKYEALLNGEMINTGEKRLVLHHLTRGLQCNRVLADGEDKRSFYLEQQNRINMFAKKVHSGEIRGEAGPFKNVVQIGIGGSDLGPRAIYLALENYARQKGMLRMNAYFISNVDPDDAYGVLNGINLAETLFILVSKSGTTLETLTNETLVKNMLVKENLNPAKHMIAVTSKTSPLAGSEEYLDSFYIDDYIGGRYSSTSAVGGAVLSLAIGGFVFDRFLQGASAQDTQSRERDIRKNPELLDALIGIWERNVLGYATTAVLPYSQGLSRFPAHLQQADMESNGKSVNRFGDPVNYKTGPVLFGEPGTNGQHSFYQLLHQGTDIVPLQFIGFATNQGNLDYKVKGSTSREKLCANLAAQIVAFACGKDDDNPNKRFDGGRPSSLIYGDKFSPEALGSLLSHFENKIMFQGFAWNLNSFDQEGVQLGKKLATQVLSGECTGALEAYSKMFIKR